ncbi:MAG: hypothetical protein ACLQDV_12500 [Candidatus Binataceae bacterium]
MADNDDPKKTQPYEKQKTESIPAEGDEVGTPLSVHLRALVDEIKANREADTAEHNKDRRWQRVIAGLGLAASLATLAVLVKTCGVYNAINRTEVTQATIMATQAMIMRGQKDITENTLKPMREQAQAASTQAAASLANAQAAARSAEEAHKANNEALEIFKEEQAPQLSLTAQAEDFGTPQATVRITLLNTGKTAAKDIDIRSWDASIPFEGFARPIPPAPLMQIPAGSSPETIAELQESNAEIAEENALDAIQTNEFNPDFAGDEQAPVVPSESYLLRRQVLWRKREARFQKGIEEANRMMEENPQRLGKNGIKMVPTLHLPLEQKYNVVIVGELGSGASMNYTVATIETPAQPEAVQAIKDKKRQYYFACRFSYTDNRGQPRESSNFCFRYNALTNALSYCIQPAKSQPNNP